MHLFPSQLESYFLAQVQFRYQFWRSWTPLWSCNSFWLCSLIRSRKVRESRASKSLPAKTHYTFKLIIIFYYKQISNIPFIWVIKIIKRVQKLLEASNCWNCVIIYHPTRLTLYQSTLEFLWYVTYTKFWLADCCLLTFCNSWFNRACWLVNAVGGGRIWFYWLV